MFPGGVYHPDEDGQPDFSRPMTPVEIIEMHWEAADFYPHTLAEFYLNFHNFQQVEFLIFEQRLSAAILVANAARAAISELKADIRLQRADLSGKVAGWEGETNMVHDESLEVASEAERLAVGAVIVTAAAALEGLVADLMDDVEDDHAGLARSVRALVKRYGVGRARTRTIESRLRAVTQRRNQFAHELTGPYWPDHGATGETFDAKALHDTLFDIAFIAIELESIVSDSCE